MKPLQAARVTDKDLEVHPLRDSADVLAWTGEDPVLHFVNADLNTVIRRIARWHQVKVYNPDNVAGGPITGVFRQKESLEVTLGILDRAEKGYAFLKRKGDTIEVSAAASR
jgi:ferric-dicitrate binding protein FerR (iron transport regulator)